MTDSVMFWVAGFATGLVFGARIGWIWAMPRDRDRDWRRSFNHENVNRPSEPPPYRFRKREPVKPQFPAPKTIKEDFLP